MSTVQSYDSAESGASAPTPLIPLSIDRHGNQAVSARVLHSFLKVKRDFTTWCKQMFEYGFEEGLDYYTVHVTKNGDVDNQALKFSAAKRSSMGISTDYVLTLDCGKEIAMLQRTLRGRQARRYFIECEKKLKEIVFASNHPAITALVKLINDQTEKILGLEGKINRMHKAQEEYFKTKVVQDADQTVLENKLKRERILAMAGTRIRFSLTATWDQFWEKFEETYNVDIRGLEKGKNESRLDVAIRHGYADRMLEFLTL